MPADSAILLVTLLVFGSIGLALSTVIGHLARRQRLRRRFGTLALPDAGGNEPDRSGERWLDVDPRRLGLDAEASRALRRDLVRAAFFDPGAVVAYTLARFALLVLVPLAGTLAVAVALPRIGRTELVLVALVLAVVALYLPRAFLSRRQTWLEARYRLTFPNFLDMLVVCINAGLSLEAALDRAARELGKPDAEFRANFDLMAGEMRAGKATTDALRACADRLGLVEARSFAALLHQTLELGTDVALALTIFADEMRDKRMSRAEETAASLPPKLTLPLGLFIFPVVLIVVLAPAVLRIVRAASP